MKDVPDLCAPIVSLSSKSRNVKYNHLLHQLIHIDL